MEFFSHQTSYPFMATRKVWYTLSAVLMVVSLASFFTRGLNLTIDFTGGVSAEARFQHAANVDEVRERLSAAGFREPQVQNFGSSRDIA
ncbi:MAG: protein translocase subunit SecF, partial [Gammaproteobacteria bacterium]